MEHEHSFPVNSESVFPSAVFHVKNASSYDVNSVRSVSIHHIHIKKD